MSEDEASGVGAGVDAGSAFEAPLDPQRTAPTEEQVRAAEEAVCATGRWHKNGADVLAVQLQIGRGLSKEEVAKTFRVGLSTLTHWVRDFKWSKQLVEERRRALSWQVMLAGYARRCRGDDIDLDEVRKAAEWRAIAAPRAKAGPRQDFGGFIQTSALRAQQTSTDNGNDGQQADPHLDGRNYFRRRLDEILAELEAEAAEEAEGEEADEVDLDGRDAGDPGRA